MLGEIVEKGASEKNDVDFDIGIVVFAAPQVNVAGYETPIIPVSYTHLKMSAVRVSATHSSR